MEHDGKRVCARLIESVCNICIVIRASVQCKYCSVSVAKRTEAVKSSGLRSQNNECLAVCIVDIRLAQLNGRSRVLFMCVF